MSRDLIAYLTDDEVKSLQFVYEVIITEAVKENMQVKKMIDKDLYNFVRPLLTQQMALDLKVDEFDIESLFIIKFSKNPETDGISLSLKRRLN
jgi:hypothetical protein